MLRGGSVLAIGAHPDDIEFGCYGTLCLLASAAQIHALVLSPCAEDGWGTIDSVPTREVETRAALAPVARTIDVLDLRHADLEYATQANVHAVETAIAK